MNTLDALLFIDANLYLDLYEVTKGKKLLEPLREQRDYIFVTVQVVEEVQRRKLKVAADFLTRQFKAPELRNFDVPDHLFDVSGETATDLLAKLGEIHDKIKTVNTDLINAAVKTLQRISLSEDEVSKALATLFGKAIQHTPEELQRARDRKERGNPPGKPEGPLGDQLTWEQLLSHGKGKSKVWIISKDRDHCTKHGDKLFLNPFLYQDLARVTQPPPAVVCFDNIGDGLRDFARTTGVKAEKLPTVEESKEIKKELDSLPPRGWLDTSMDDANLVALLAQFRQRLMSPALRAALQNQGDEGQNLWLPPDPDKTDK